MGLIQAEIIASKQANLQKMEVMHLSLQIRPERGKGRKFGVFIRRRPDGWERVKNYVFVPKINQK